MTLKLKQPLDFFLTITTVLIIFYSCADNETTEIIAYDQKEMIITNFDKGKSYFQNKKYDLAILEFDSALQINPNVAIIYCYRGMAKAGKADFVSGIIDLETCIRLNPANNSSLYEKANIEFEANMLDVAIKDYSLVIEKDSSFHDAYLNRGLAKLKAGSIKEACEDFNFAKIYGNMNAEKLIKDNCIKE